MFVANKRVIQFDSTVTGLSKAILASFCPSNRRHLSKARELLEGYSVFKDLVANLSRLAGTAMCQLPIASLKTRMTQTDISPLRRRIRAPLHSPPASVKHSDCPIARRLIAGF